MSAAADRRREQARALLLADPRTPIVDVAVAVNGTAHAAKRVAGAPALCGLPAPVGGWQMPDSWAPAPTCSACAAARAALEAAP